jgi:peptidoglycan hydrolase CwlO-like protein
MAEQQTPLKNITISATLLVTVLASIGTTVFNLYDKGNNQKFEAYDKEIKDLTDQISVLHRRISETSNSITSLQINLAGYNALLTVVQTDISEIKSDIKEMIRNKP